MALPIVKIIFVDGFVGGKVDTSLEYGLVATAVAVVGKFELNKAYSVRKLDDLTPLGITEASNPAMYKAVFDFYTEAPDGIKLWLYGVAETVTLANMVDVDGTVAKAFAISAKGGIRGLMLAKNDAQAYTPTILNGLDSDVATAKTKAQAFGEWMADNKYAPLFVVLPGRHYAGDDDALADQTEDTANRVCIVIGDTVADSNDAAVGLVLGRKAKDPLRRALHRVRTGRIAVNAEGGIFIGDTDALEYDPTTIDEKGYISFRGHIGKAGYFFTNDWMCTSKTSDYAILPRRCVIDEAYRLAYLKTIELLGEEFDVTADGKLPVAVIKSIETEIEDYIVTNLAADISKNPDDPKDSGVKVFIDSNQDFLSNAGFDMDVGIKPFGYADYININLHYSTETV